MADKQKEQHPEAPARTILGKVLAGPVCIPESKPLATRSRDPGQMEDGSRLVVLAG